MFELDDFSIPPTLTKKENEHHRADAKVAGTPDSIAVKKVVSLSKQVRHLTSRLYSEKAKSCQLQGELEKATSDAASKLLVDKSEAELGEDEMLDKLKHLQASNSQLKCTLNKIKGQHATLTRDLQKAKHVLQTELNVKITNFRVWLNRRLVNQNLTGNGSKDNDKAVIGLDETKRLKARIAYLESISSLRMRPENADDQNSIFDRFTTDLQPLTELPLKSSRLSRAIRQPEDEQLITDLQSQLDRERLKVKGSLARQTYLSDELNSVKAKLATLMSKGQHDDELIDQLVSAKKAQLEETVRLSQDIVKIKQDNFAQCKDLHEIAINKEAQIQILKDTTSQLERELSEARRIPTCEDKCIETEQQTEKETMKENVEGISQNVKLEQEVEHYRALLQEVRLRHATLLANVREQEKTSKKTSPVETESTKVIRPDSRTTVLKDTGLRRLVAKTVKHRKEGKS